MAKKPQVDVRKLKDEVTELLKKSKWEKAADVLEQLVAAEPKDMSHRLKLGDAYRRMEQIEKSIVSYQHAARFFADEGQMIKAIGAVKIILEIDPRNDDAQKQLKEMNERRFSKVTLESTGIKAKAGIGAGARATSPIELEEAESAAAAVESALDEPEIMPEIALGDDDEPLELDDGKPSKASKRAAAPPPRAAVPPRAIVPPPPDELDLDLADPAAPEKLPDDAILTPQAEDLISSPHEDEVIPLDEYMPPPPPSKAPSKAPAVTVADEISIEEEAPAPARAPRKKAIRTPPPPRPGGAQPIADLLSVGTEEEIELLSITSHEEAAGERPMAGEKLSPDESDLDAAFGKMAPQVKAPRKKLPSKKVPLFDDLSQEAFVELVNKLGYHRHVPGQLIIREGDPGRSFFIIVEGKVRIYKLGPDEKEITLAHLGEGAFFGEMALLSGAPRTANVVAEEDTEILEVTDTVLRELTRKYPQVVSSLKNFYRQRLLNNVMAISPLFKDFDPSERKSIVEKFRMKQATPGEVLITEGKNSDGLYVVLHGSVQVLKRDKNPIELAKLKEGDVFGEMSLLTRQPATATVTSQSNSILLRLPRENFQELVLTHPQILELVSELTERRKSATEAILQGQGEGHDGMSFV